MENMFWIGFIGAAIALIFAIIQRKKVMSFTEGTDRMAEIAQSIRDGANAYLKRQYKTVAVVFAIVLIIMCILAAIGLLGSWFIPLAFLVGGICSATAGYVGMKIATSANARTAQAAHEGLNRGLQVAFSSGSVMGFTVVGLGLLEVTTWFHVL